MQQRSSPPPAHPRRCHLTLVPPHPAREPGRSRPAAVAVVMRPAGSWRATKVSEARHIPPRQSFRRALLLCVCQSDRSILHLATTSHATPSAIPTRAPRPPPQPRSGSTHGWPRCPWARISAMTRPLSARSRAVGASSTRYGRPALPLTSLCLRPSPHSPTAPLPLGLVTPPPTTGVGADRGSLRVNTRRAADSSGRPHPLAVVPGGFRQWCR